MEGFSCLIVAVVGVIGLIIASQRSASRKSRGGGGYSGGGDWG